MFSVRNLFLMLALSAAGAQAQQYPSKPVRVIVGFTAGGPSDIVGRIVAAQFRPGESRAERRAGPEIV